jgi:molecular chaperone DnaK
MVYTTEKTVKEAGDKLDAATKEKVEKAKEELKKVLEENKSDEIKAKLEALQKEVYEMSAKIYAQGGPIPGTEGAAGAGAQEAGPQGENNPGGTGKDDKTVDADFEEKK